MEESRINKAFGVCLIIIPLLMVGCNDDVLVEHQNELEELREQKNELEEIIENQQQIIEQHDTNEFSYLEGFTESELKAYEDFFEDKDVKHLKDYSPTSIVLVYFHSVVIGDTEAIYSLTFNDDNLPDISTFKEKYYSGNMHKHLLETTLDFRYYDSIEVKEANDPENEIAVEIGVSFGLFHSKEVLGLKNENGIWKMDILHLF